MNGKTKNTVILRLNNYAGAFTFAKKMMVYRFKCTCKRCGYYKEGIEFGAYAAAGVRKVPVLNKLNKSVESIVLANQIGGLGVSIIPYTSRRLKSIFSLFGDKTSFVDIQNKINANNNRCPRCSTYNLSFILQ